MAASSRVVLVCNAPLEPMSAKRLQQAVREPGTVVVGVDGGAARLQRFGILPHVVTGDFDSLTKDDVTRLRTSGATIVPTPDQDYTDFDKALTYVRETYPGAAIAVFGAVGGRLDHTVSVLSAVIKHGVFGGADIRLIDAVGETRPVRGGERIYTGDDLPGRVVSLLALGTVRGVTLSGVRWALNNETLAPGVRDGALNEITNTQVSVRCERDAPLLVQVHHAPRVSGA